MTWCLIPWLFGDRKEPGLVIGSGRAYLYHSIRVDRYASRLCTALFGKLWLPIFHFSARIDPNFPLTTCIEHAELQKPKLRQFCWYTTPAFLTWGLGYTFIIKEVLGPIVRISAKCPSRVVGIIFEPRCFHKLNIIRFHLGGVPVNYKRTANAACIGPERRAISLCSKYNLFCNPLWTLEIPFWQCSY